ncbi:MAG: hypothetical protein U9N73_10250 [Candidatus Auribacterota bacterium]|nr:hypothetical protein [Candidatus Auribacterota bacterium]
MIIKSWYQKKYPSDMLGNDIRSDLTFESLFKAMDSYENPYKTIGVYDSVVRERIFEKLAEIMNVDYNYILDQMRNGND